MKVIRHEDKCLQRELALIPVLEQHAAEQFGKLSRLKERTLLPGTRADEERLFRLHTWQSSWFQERPQRLKPFQSAALWHS
jgi:hypothetical protein